jgi:hypothetical protein
MSGTASIPHVPVNVRPFCFNVQSELAGASSSQRWVMSREKSNVQTPETRGDGADAMASTNAAAASFIRSPSWVVAHFSRTRVPLIFWLLSAVRKFGTRRSISSKYEDKAGVFCCALYRISSR